MAGSEIEYYDKSPLLSYNGLFNFTIGARGVGKTFAFKLWAMTGQGETVWVRRTKEDIQHLMQNDGTEFYSDLMTAGKIPYSADITVDESALYINGERKIIFIPLSVSRRFKSMSFPNVKRIVFDEFIEKGTTRNPYLKDEVNIFFDLYETVNRLRPEGKEVRCFFIGNKISFMNPYFAHFHITPFTERFRRYVDGLVIVENYSSASYQEAKAQSPFGKLVQGTAFGDYSINNIVWDDTDAFVEKRNGGTLVCTIRYGESLIGIYNCAPYLWCSFAKPTNVPSYALKYETEDGEIVLSKAVHPLKTILWYYEQSMLRFDSSAIKSLMFAVFQEA